MRVYTYYMKPGRTAVADAVAVREGFSWAALLFGFAWALYRRLWLVAIVLAALPAVFYHLASSLPGSGLATVAVALYGLFALFAAFSANDLRREKLERRGHVLAGIAVGRSLAEADLRFFERADARPPRPPTMPPPTPPAMPPAVPSAMPRTAPPPLP